MLWVTIILLIIVGVATLLLKGRLKHETIEYPYQEVNSLFSPAERSFFGVLEKAVGDEYSKGLLSHGEAAEAGLRWAEQEESDTFVRIRDQGFRKAIVSIYDHRCALCGIRMLTPDGHTVVEAAHIKPWSESHDDKPTNGLSLCRLCHWSFDEGLMSVGAKYEVLVSRRVQTEHNLPGHILTLRDRSIFTPTEDHYWPAQDNLDHHRTKRFLG
jgi:putative restriction endonuclease